jgi:hypothetical protein
MNVLDIVVMVLSLAFSAAFLCRLDGLDIWKDKLMVILFYVSCLGALIASARNAWEGFTDIHDVCIVMACAAYIGMSYKTWRTGPPSYIKRGHA